MATPALTAGGLELRSTSGRWVVAATVLGSAIVIIDATVVNIALPAIGRDFHTGIAALQWTVTAYTLTLSAFILIGGALGDRYGRRRMFMTGVVWFAAASLLCGVAPTDTVLIAARALQGAGAALLMPESLAILQATFRPEDRPAAIGMWSGLGGVATAIGPFLGGYLITVASWRLIFLINLPLVAAVLWIAGRHVPETFDQTASGRLDFGGATLAAVGLGGVIFGLIEGPTLGWTSAIVLVALIGGTVVLAAFGLLEMRERNPMLPLSIFRSRQFSGANAVTFLVYGALGGALFMLPIQLQQVLGYSPFLSGVALLPITVILLLFSARAGRLSQRIGPRLPMTFGPIVAGVGLALLSRVMAGGTYAATTFVGLVVFSLGMALTIAPLTSAVLSAAPVEKAGLASAVNNAVARAAGLIAVAALPAVAGIGGAAYLHPATFSAGFQEAMLIAGALCAAGGALAFITIPRQGAAQVAREPAGAGERAGAPAPTRVEAEPIRPAGGVPALASSSQAGHRTEPAPLYHCALDATPLCSEREERRPEAGRTAA
jgi:EmrB/QacA subfamily drug resistance transporter